MSKLIRDVREVQQFLELHVAAGASSEDSARLVRVQCNSLQAKFRATPPSVTDATEILHTINRGPWPATHRQELLQALASSISHASPTAGPQAVQVFMDVDIFCPRRCGEKLGDDAMSERGKLHSYCGFLAQLGLAHPSERSAQSCTSKFWLAVQGPAAFDMEPPMKLLCLQDFKSVLKRFVAAHPRTQSFPETPALWHGMQPELHAAVNASEPAAPSRLSRADVARIVHRWPMRGSNADVAKRKSETMLDPKSAMGAMVQMAQMFAHMQQQQLPQQHGAASVEVPTLSIFERGRRDVADAQSRRVQMLLDDAASSSSGSQALQPTPAQHGLLRRSMASDNLSAALSTADEMAEAPPPSNTLDNDVQCGIDEIEEEMKKRRSKLVLTGAKRRQRQHQPWEPLAQICLLIARLCTTLDV